MKFFLLNGEYRIAEESHNNDVGSLVNWTLCSSKVVKSEINRENWVNYAMIGY